MGRVRDRASLDVEAHLYSRLEHFQPKWMPVRRKKMRQKQQDRAFSAIQGLPKTL
jgi:hypothetical protein